jgi:hypothetical protein
MISLSTGWLSMEDPDQIEVSLTQLLKVRATGKLAIIAAAILVLWVSTLALFPFSN